MNAFRSGKGRVPVPLKRTVSRRKRSPFGTGPGHAARGVLTEGREVVRPPGRRVVLDSAVCVCVCARARAKPAAAV